MLAKRLIVAIILVPIGIGLFAIGGWPMLAFVAIALGRAGWEYARLFRTGGYQPYTAVLITGSAGLVVARSLFQGPGSEFLLALAVLVAMAAAVISYEQGRETAAVDFNITLGGVLYLGWLGSYLVLLRNLPDGLWWFLLVMPAVWFTDAGAFFIGSAFGRHKMSPVVSPKKTWEGYLGGILVGALGSMLLASLWHMRAPNITVMKGAIIGLVIGALTPMGDLGESMLKRTIGVKDTSNLLPGHGGVMDRIDSWLWAAVIGYYLILFSWL